MTQSTAPAPAAAIGVPAAVRRFGMVVFSHPVLDAYAGFVTPLVGVLQVRCELSEGQAASLLGIGALTSGLSQPLFAWLTDRIDSRAFGSIGLAVAAACLSSIGLAHDYLTLVVLYVLGMAGVGAFHPVAAASAGQLAGRRRSAGVTLFFVAGMIGATLGPILSTRITAIDPNGFDLLRWLMIPGLLVALLLHIAIRRVPHRHHEHRTIRFEAAELRRRWLTIIVLFIGNAMRYSVNIGLFYVYVRWAESVMRGDHPTAARDEIATLGSIYSGELNAITMAGMGLGGLLAGTFIRRGREKWPIVLAPMLLAPAIVLFPFVGRWVTYPMALVAGLGFAAILPLTISLAQRLLPQRTSLASSLAMGAAWATAMFAPSLAQWSIDSFGLTRTFAAIAGVLALSGLVGLGLPTQLISHVARD
jgi:FSR family fosmidomycin resistance protein-like MFS transporter